MSPRTQLVQANDTSLPPANSPYHVFTPKSGFFPVNCQSSTVVTVHAFEKKLEVMGETLGASFEFTNLKKSSNLSYVSLKTAGSTLMR